MPRDLKVRTVFTAKDRMSRTVNRMQSRVRRFARRAKALLRSVGKAGLAAGRILGGGLKIGFMAVAGAALAAGYAIQKMTGELDTLAKDTRSMDFPIEEFQEWRYAAEQSGIGNDKFGKGMLTFNKRLGKLKGGFGPLAAAVKKVDPQLGKMLSSTTNTAEAMDVMNNAIRDAKGADMKAMLADAAFGVTKMSLLSGNTKEGLAALRAEMQENGVVTAEQAAAAEAFNDTMNRLKLTLSGVFRDAVMPFVPDLQAFAENIRAWAVANKGLIKTKVKEWAFKLWDGLKKFGDWLKKNWPEIKKAAEAIVEFGKSILGLIQTLWQYKEVVMALGAAFLALKLAQVGASVASFAGSLSTVAGPAGAASGAIGKLGGALGAGGLVMAAGAAGYAIGTLITGLLNAAQDKSRKKSNDLVLENRGLGGKTDAELDALLSKNQGAIKNASGFGAFASDLFSGRGTNKDLRTNSRMNQTAILEEKMARLRKQKQMQVVSQAQKMGLDPGAALQSMGMKPQRGVLPQASVKETKTETVTKEQVEIILQDNTSGSVQVKRTPKGKNYKIKHTGEVAPA